MSGVVVLEKEIKERISQARRLLVALDFDGTIAPLVPRPEDARALPETAALLPQLDALARDSADTSRPTFVAMVSGRDIASLHRVAQPGEHAYLVGSHGAELRLPAGVAENQAPALSDAQRDLLAKVTQRLEAVQADNAASFLEYKTLSTVLHTRGMEATAASRAITQAEDALGDLAGVSLKHGKEIVEAAVAHSNKGEGLLWLREQTGADCVLFAGDDVTDEQGFAALEAGRDVTVKVGAGETVAEFRISGPESLPDLLQLVLDVRS